MQRIWWVTGEDLGLLEGRDAGDDLPSVEEVERATGARVLGWLDRDDAPLLLDVKDARARVREACVRRGSVVLGEVVGEDDAAFDVACWRANDDGTTVRLLLERPEVEHGKREGAKRTRNRRPPARVWVRPYLDGRPAQLVPEMGRSGVYAIRQWGVASAEVLYVGESHKGRLRKTLMRHFQKWNPAIGVSYDAAGEVEVALQLAPASEAVELQRVWVEELRPRDTVRPEVDADDPLDPFDLF